MKTFISHIVLAFIALIMTHSLYAQGTWSTASSDGFSPRFAGSASEVGGKIYAIGGWGRFSLVVDSIEIFDPYSNSWAKPITTGTFTPRWGHKSEVVDGKIYVIGGITGTTSGQDTVNTLEVFDPATNSWSTPVTTGTFTARAIHTSAVVNGKIYVIGGVDAGVYISTLEVFDPSTNSWSAPEINGSFIPSIARASCVVDGKIYISGRATPPNVDNTLEVFDPTTNTWSELSTTGTFTGRRGLTTTLLDNKIYAIGGLDANNQTLNTVEVFDLSTNSWTSPQTTGSFTSRYSHTSTVINGKIYTLGGQTATSVGSDINEVFTPTSSSVVTDASSRNFAPSPNPTSGIVTIHGAPLNTSNITVVNVLGETVLTQENVQATDFSVDLSNLPSGVYYLRIASPTSITTKMVVKK